MKFRSLSLSTTIALMITANAAISSTEYCATFMLENTKDELFRGTAEFPYSPSEYSHGLKGRDVLDPTTAMIFDMDNRVDAVLWMQDTPAPLDIAFFDEERRLIHIAYNTTPFSEEYIQAPDNPPISYALELPAGRADEIGLQTGATLLYVAAPVDCPINPDTKRSYDD